VLGVATFERLRGCRGGGSGKQLEDAGKTLGRETLGGQPLDASARDRSGRQQSLAPRVHQDTE